MSLNNPRCRYCGHILELGHEEDTATSTTLRYSCANCLLPSIRILLSDNTGLIVSDEWQEAILSPEDRIRLVELLDAWKHKGYEVAWSDRELINFCAQKFVGLQKILKWLGGTMVRLIEQ